MCLLVTTRVVSFDLIQLRTSRGYFSSPPSQSNLNTFFPVHILILDPSLMSYLSDYFSTAKINNPYQHLGSKSHTAGTLRGAGVGDLGVFKEKKNSICIGSSIYNVRNIKMREKESK